MWKFMSVEKKSDFLFAQNSCHVAYKPQASGDIHCLKSPLSLQIEDFLILRRGRGHISLWALQTNLKKSHSHWIVVITRIICENIIKIQGTE